MPCWLADLSQRDPHIVPMTAADFRRMRSLLPQEAAFRDMRIEAPYVVKYTNGEL